MGFAGGDARGALIRRKAPTNAGIDRSLRPLRRTGGTRDLGLDVGACAKAGIEQAAHPQLFKRGGIFVHLLGLAHGRAIPGQPQPGQVLEDRVFEGGFAARVIDVFDAQQKLAASRARGALRDMRGIGVAEMQVACGARRESRFHDSSPLLQQ